MHLCSCNTNARRMGGGGSVREWGIKEIEKKINWVKHTKNRAVSRRVVLRELREDSAMLLNAWKSRLWFLLPRLCFPVSKRTWKLFWGIEQVEVDCERKWGRAGQSSELFLYPMHRSRDLIGPKAQWPSTLAKHPQGGTSGNWRLQYSWQVLHHYFPDSLNHFVMFWSCPVFKSEEG